MEATLYQVTVKFSPLKSKYISCDEQFICPMLGTILGSIVKTRMSRQISDLVLTDCSYVISIIHLNLLFEYQIIAQSAWSELTGSGFRETGVDKKSDI